MFKDNDLIKDIKNLSGIFEKIVRIDLYKDFNFLNFEKKQISIEKKLLCNQKFIINFILVYKLYFIYKNSAIGYFLYFY